MRVYLVAVLVIMSTALSAQTSGTAQFWIPARLKWVRVAGAPNIEHIRTASATVLYFGANGEFVRDDCWLIRKDHSITISNGDPHNEFAGHWEPIADGMQVTYRLRRRTVERKGEVLPGKTISETSSMPKAGLMMGNRLFHRVRLANASDYLESYLALARQGAND